MSFISENILPGTHGKTFIVDMHDDTDYRVVMRALSKVKGIGQVEYQENTYPHEMTIHTASPVPIKEVQEKVRNVGFHVIPKSFFLFDAL